MADIDIGSPTLPFPEDIGSRGDEEARAASLEKEKEEKKEKKGWFGKKKSKKVKGKEKAKQANLQKEQPQNSIQLARSSSITSNQSIRSATEDGGRDESARRLSRAPTALADAMNSNNRDGEGDANDGAARATSAAAVAAQHLPSGTVSAQQKCFEEMANSTKE